jgi:O-methyltransferase involved in polyketide biosynthesis
LARAGFRHDRPAFFQWLGVTPYLTRETISSTLDFIAGVPGSAVAFDYTEPFENQSPERRARLTAMAESAAARDEPWLSFFDPPEVISILRGKGFQDIEDLGFADLIRHYSPELGRGLLPGGGHVIRAGR